MAQPIDNRQKLINQDGTPTEYFIRVLRDRGLSGDSTEQQLIELSNTVATLELDDLTDVDLVTTPPVDGEALTYDSGLGLWVPGAGGGGGGGGVPLTFAQFREQQPNGTVGGPSAVGWQTRILNTTVVNSIPGVSLASNVITVPAGTYRIHAVATTYRPDRTKIRVRNITDGVTILNGVSDYANPGNGFSRPEGDAYVSFSAPKQLELQHFITSTDGTFGLGVESSGSGEPEVYAEVIIEQVGGVAYAGGGFLSTELTPIPTYQNGWVDFGPPFIGTKIVKTGRQVTMTGLVKDGPNNTVVFTLPAGWRPAVEIFGPVEAGGTIGNFRVKVNGDFESSKGGGSYSAFDITFIVPEIDAYNGGPGMVAVDSGIAFPSSPALSQRFFRVDRGIEYFWDGTYWLSVELLTASFPSYGAIGGTNYTYGAVPYLGTYDLWLENWDYSGFKVGSADWDVSVGFSTITVADTKLSTRNNAADPDNVWVGASTSLGVLLSSTATVFEIFYERNSGGALYGAVSLSYRLIG